MSELIHRSDLFKIARAAMLSRGLEPDFPEGALRQLAGIKEPAHETEETKDLTHLLWCSIDNDDSRDLDQISVAEKLDNDHTRILVGIADVDAVVKNESPIDQHAKTNTTTVYTGVTIFPMLPERLSTDLTSLSENEYRCAIVIEFVVDGSGHIVNSDIYKALVKNRAKLAYPSVSAWLDGAGPLPHAAGKTPGIDQQLRLQDHAAQRMRKLRYEHGALELETIEPRAVMKGGEVVDLRHEKKNRAGELIEDFMIAANGVVARFLTKKGFPSLRRVVRNPERWEKIRQVALEYGQELPAEPNALALSRFLSVRREKDVLRFPDLSLTIVKLLGRGEYVLESPGQETSGHFGLAVKNYTHSTAPNRRYPDVITQRLLKAALKNSESPYSLDELAFLARHCTENEDAADRVERRVRKSASAMLLSQRIGEYFDGIITGASQKGTWARVILPPVEGKIIHGAQGLDVGDRVRLKLIGVDVEQGFIDFARVHN